MKKGLGRFVPSTFLIAKGYYDLTIITKSDAFNRKKNCEDGNFSMDDFYH